MGPKCGPVHRVRVLAIQILKLGASQPLMGASCRLSSEKGKAFPGLSNRMQAKVSKLAALAHSLEKEAGTGGGSKGDWPFTGCLLTQYIGVETHRHRTEREAASAAEEIRVRGPGEASKLPCRSGTKRPFASSHVKTDTSTMSWKPCFGQEREICVHNIPQTNRCDQGHQSLIRHFE